MRWQYTPRAVAAMRGLRQKFPALVAAVDANPRKDVYDAAEVFADGEGSVEEHCDEVRRVGSSERGGGVANARERGRMERFIRSLVDLLSLCVRAG